VSDVKHIAKSDVPKMLIQLEKEMREAADNLEFELAIAIRDKMERLKAK